MTKVSSIAIEIKSSRGTFSSIAIELKMTDNGHYINSYTPYGGAPSYRRNIQTNERYYSLVPTFESNPKAN